MLYEILNEFWLFILFFINEPYQSILTILQWLKDHSYEIIEYFLNLTGGYIPTEDYPVFLTTLILAGWMVAVDACLFEIAVFPFVEKKYWLPIIILITLVHAFAGYLGLGSLVAGLMTGVTLWIMLSVTCWGGLRFIVNGRIADDDDDPTDMAKKLAAGILTIAALFMYWNVSFDEFFAVWQRFQWMLAQEWNVAAMAVNIGLSMIVLFAIQCFVALCLLIFKPITNWIHDRGDYVMYFVFSLLMYYMVRGVMQNGLGYDPYEIPYTGLAPDLVILGFVLTLMLFKALKNKKFANGAKLVLYIK